MSDYAYQLRQQIDDSDYGYFKQDSIISLRKKVKRMSFETLLDEYQTYVSRGIWNPAPPFKDTFKWIQYGIELKMELQRRDRKGSKIL